MGLFSILCNSKDAKGTMRKYKVFIGVLVGVLIIGTLWHFRKPDNPTGPQVSPTGQNKPRHELEDEANDLYNKLLKEISTDVASDAQNGTSMAVYPDNYGGAYLGEDGALVVCMTADKWGRNLLKLEEIFEATDYYKVETVQYSLNQLKWAHSEFVKCLSEYSDVYSPDSAEYKLFSSVAGLYTNQMTNAVIVNMKDVTAEKLQLFDKIFGNSAGMYFIREVG